MSNYAQSTFFANKDNLATSNPAKKILGSEVDTELAAISSAVSSKVDGPNDIEAGTRMLFVQASVPTGWTIVTGFDDRAVILEDTAAQGGANGGNWTLNSTAFDVNASLPNHTHNAGNLTANITLTNAAEAGNTAFASTNAGVGLNTMSGDTGNLVSSPSINITKSGTATNGNWRPAYTKAIVCSRN